MGAMSVWHWLIVLVAFMVLFGGRGKISEVMGDFAKGIKSFKKGMTDDDEDKAQPAPGAKDPRIIDHATTASAATDKSKVG